MSAPYHDGDALAVSAQDEYYHNARERSINEDDQMEEYLEKPPPPRKQPLYKNKKFLISCGVISAIVVIVVVCLMIFVFFPMICQSLMNQAGVSVNAAQITFSQPSGQNAKRDFNPQNTFMMNMDSSLSNTGPFAATIKFHNPITIFYNDTLLGNVTLPDTNIGGGKGSLKANTPFDIQDVSYFTNFAKDMLAMDTFYWTMKGSADITALGRTATVNLDKYIPIPGMGGFKDVSIKSFQLPSNAPQGGINVELGTMMNAPSPVGIELGTINLQIGYQGVNLGTVSASGVNLQQGGNLINLKGVIQPLNNTADLDKVGDMFSKYVSGGVAQTSAIGVSAAPDGTNSIGWLSEAFKSVSLNVGLQNQGGPLNIIHGVSMGYLDLGFNANNAYAPSINAPAVIADFSIPFGFTLDIYEVTQNITMSTPDGGNFSQLVVPWVPAQSNQQAGKLQFGINQGTLQTLEGKNDAFDKYTYDLTASNGYTFGVSGVATTKTVTPIGNITLAGVTFNVNTTLHGLQFLNSTPTTIGTVDMTGGTKEGLLLNIGVGMGNPSDFSMSVGDVTFAMFSGASQVGTAALKNLTLQRGQNSVTAVATFDPNGSQDGKNMLASFVEGKNSSTSIAGFDQSTNIASLSKAFQAINIGTTLPGLTTQLVQSANLVVLPNSAQTSTVNVAVALNNPFTAGLSISKIVSSATYKGMPVGNINQDISSNPFVATGKAVSNSQPLDMSMNMEPAALALLMRDLAVDAGLNTNALDALLGMGGFHVQGQQDVSPTVDVFKGFNISDFVIKASSKLIVNLNLDSTMQVGDYVTDLAFVQNNVQVKSDWTITRLIPIVGQPIVQAIVNGAVLGFDTLLLSDPTETNAKVQMKGSITKTGPMDAAISFPSPLSVRFQGKEIGLASMPTVQAAAGQGAQFDVPSNFQITDGEGMQNFASYMINNEEFVWEIVSSDVSVNALGFTFTNISMNKFVTIKGCNGFKNGVVINSFDLPRNDPAGGITLTTATSITNPSQVGFSLQSVNFLAFFQNVELGPLGASPGNFAPVAQSNVNMTGRLIPQKSQEGLDAVTKVFENYLAAQDSLVDVKGDSASGPAGQVQWLTNAFKTLTINNVVMPGPKVKPQLIPSITMMNMQLDFTKDAWAPSAGSTLVQAKLQSPFGFPLGVSQLSMEVDAEVQKQKMAHLSIPTQKATTDANNVVTTAFSDVPFKVSAQPLFAGFLAALTHQANGTFELAGASNALADTAIGAIQLNNVTFDVSTSMAGFNNFDSKTQIVSTAVTGGTPEYLIVTTVVAFNNPSQITITVGDINFNAKLGNDQIGQVFIKQAIIKPGNNQFDAEFHLFGAAGPVGQVFSDYMTNAQVPLTIFGTEKSTSIASLQPAFQTVSLATTMQGFQANLIAGCKVIATLGGVLQKKAKAVVTLQNPLKTDYVLTDLKADVFYAKGGSTFKVGHVTGIPEPCSVPSGGNTNCAEWDVNLDANLIQLLQLITAPDKSMNMQQNITSTVGGSNGYKATFYYYQDNVATSMELDAGLLNLPLGAQVNSTGNPTESMGSESGDTPATKTGSASASVSVTSSATATEKPTDTPAKESGDASSKPTTTPAAASAA
ncbi:hypothetical protein BC940DRAFT_345179 [Gongronella butleri]|nr:hypothetical protein BC940DRAFT_345179 [Gongronella butleri]